MDEETSKEDAAKFKWGACGPNEMEYAAARTPLQIWSEPSVHTSMHSMEWGVENAQEGATRTLEHGCLESLMRSKISWNVNVKKSSEFSFRLFSLLLIASISSLTCWLNCN